MEINLTQIPVTKQTHFKFFLQKKRFATGIANERGHVLCNPIMFVMLFSLFLEVVPPVACARHLACDDSWIMLLVVAAC